MSRKVIIGDFPKDVINNMTTSLTAEGKLSYFGLGEVSFPQNLIQ